MEPPKTRTLSSFIIAGICGGDHKFYEAVKIPMGDTKNSGILPVAVAKFVSWFYSGSAFWLDALLKR